MNLIKKLKNLFGKSKEETRTIDCEGEIKLTLTRDTVDSIICKRLQEDIKDKKIKSYKNISLFIKEKESYINNTLDLNTNLIKNPECFKFSKSEDLQNLAKKWNVLHYSCKDEELVRFMNYIL